MLARRGTTLAELVVVLALGAIVLGVATSSLLRQQRATLSMSAAARARSQLRFATALFGAQVALHGRDDVVAGSLRDTSLQLRATVASGLACVDSVEPSFVTDADDFASGGLASPLRPGDSLWHYTAPSDSWIGHEVLGAWSDDGRCGAPGITEDSPSTTVRLRVSGTDIIPALAPLRVTRQERLVLYRAGDGTWQLGLREWNAVSRAFGSPQPAAGPFFRSPGAVRTTIRYFDDAGLELTTVADVPPDRLARVRLTVVSSVGGSGARASDSVDVSLRR